ncbi:hypothetical protein [Brevundimonas sp. GCM10030266]|uniref:hypothetical protein n=1 Tax=Brevundimonas sp. GCM10030266 TaxID=3273386 RepID=UPI00361C8FAD
MRRVLMAALVFGVMTGASVPAAAGIPMRVQSTCPVDDAKFTWTTTASYSTWGAELDAKPIGSWTFPMTIPQCPESRFPVYKEAFTDEEKAAIRALVLTPEYLAMKDEASYYLLRFVQEKLGGAEPLDPLQSAWLLLQSTWQVRETDPERYRRYAAETVTAMDAALPALLEAEPTDWWFFQIATANVQRQSGDFAGAVARLDSLTGEFPEEGQAAERIALTRQKIAAQDISSGALPDARFAEGDHEH